MTPGGLLGVQLDWQIDGATLRGDEKVTVQLIGPDGQVVAQHDTALIQAGPHGLSLPENLSPGEYRLIAAIYVAEDEGIRRIGTTDGEDAVTLWTASVD